mgnify:CR=1 FL=1
MELCFNNMFIKRKHKKLQMIKLGKTMEFEKDDNNDEKKEENVTCMS